MAVSQKPLLFERTLSVSINLDSGRTIHLARLYQYLAYEGLLEGVPSRRLNEVIVKQALNVAKAGAKQFLGMSSTPHLFSPSVTPLDVESSPVGPGPFEQLPATICIGQFVAEDSPVRHSSASFVWFQPEFALPIDKAVESAIQNINWDNVAVSFER